MKETDKNLKKLTWKYFWENKLIEVLIIINAVFIPFFLGKLYALAIPKIVFAKMFGTEYTGTILENWLIGFFGLMILTLIALVIYSIIQGNWNWAEEKAERKIKKIEKSNQ